jgi:uncharacterized membrane protein YoaK (UPF0700 family)
MLTRRLQAVIDGFDLLFSFNELAARQGARSRLRRTLPPVAGFAVGACAGAVGFLLTSFWALLLPLAALCALALLVRKAATPKVGS